MDIASLIKRARENDEALSSSKNKNKNIKNKKRKQQKRLVSACIVTFESDCVVGCLYRFIAVEKQTAINLGKLLNYQPILFGAPLLQLEYQVEEDTKPAHFYQKSAAVH